MKNKKGLIFKVNKFLDFSLRSKRRLSGGMYSAVALPPRLHSTKNICHFELCEKSKQLLHIYNKFKTYKDAKIFLNSSNVFS